MDIDELIRLAATGLVILAGLSVFFIPSGNQHGQGRLQDSSEQAEQAAAPPVAAWSAPPALTALVRKIAGLVVFLLMTIGNYFIAKILGPSFAELVNLTAATELSATGGTWGLFGITTVFAVAAGVQVATRRPYAPSTDPRHRLESPLGSSIRAGLVGVLLMLLWANTFFAWHATGSYWWLAGGLVLSVVVIELFGLGGFDRFLVALTKTRPGPC